MASTPSSPGPSYISAHSADVILSDIRPIKLKTEALQAINVLLDEFLFSILKTASSLLTDNLRASLLSLLPTTLGKEALLEAEVELRAYWDRTPSDAVVLEDGSKVFHLQWAFELLRLKCEAYSTLNESDEDHGAEDVVNERLSVAGGMLPRAELLAPAALYLTAILEAICEHILSNVGRVVARDSSRASATAQDLFIALCEDHTIYDLFKKMRVYEQIDQLSKTPKVRRSKSLTRNDKPPRTSSPHQDLSSAKDSAGRPRISSEGPANAAFTSPGPRPSLEKTRAIKMFKANARSSIDGSDVLPGHRRSDSAVSEKSSRHATTTSNDEPSTYEDEALQQEFDDLMRSSSTMKVSLTPDRLKTMEVYKQEKERGNRRPGPPSFKPELSDPPQSPLPPRATGRRPSLLRVDSIKEDDEESPVSQPASPPLPTTRNRQASVSSRPTTSPTPSRVRSLSTSSSAASRSILKLSNTPQIFQQSTAIDQSPMQNRRHVNKVQDPSFPPRTRKVQRNRESLDLDDVMNGSGDEEVFAPAPAPKASAATPKRNGHHISANTRDLIDFLAEGPPDMGPITDIGADGPPYGSSPNGKPKGGGRLQRMISKLSLSNGERSRGADDHIMKSPPPQFGRPFPSKPSLNNLSALANRPIPPRPPPAPRPISPPASPHDSSEEHSYVGTRSRSTSLVQRKSPLDASNQIPVPVPTVPVLPPQPTGSVPSNRRPQPSLVANGSSHPNSTERPYTNGNGSVHPYRDQPFSDIAPIAVKALSRVANAQNPNIPPVIASQTPVKPIASSHVATPASPVRKPPPVYIDPSSQPHISRDDAYHMHRLISRATTADECRLILDMFLTKSGISIDPKKYDAPYPSPSPSVFAREEVAAAETNGLEATLLELFLGDGSVSGPNLIREKSGSPLEAVLPEHELPQGKSISHEEPVVDVGTALETAFPAHEVAN